MSITPDAPAARQPSIFHAEARTFPQERARKTFESLLEAGQEVFAERGFDQTQTPDIAAKAGVSVGTFYRYFEDKREMFLEIVRRHLEASYHGVMSRLTPERLVGTERKQTIATAILILVDSITVNPRLHRVFLEMSMRDDKVAELRKTFDDEARRRVAELIALICTRAQVPDPESTAFVVYIAVTECALAIAGVRATGTAVREQRVEALTESVFRTLFGLTD